MGAYTDKPYIVNHRIIKKGGGGGTYTALTRRWALIFT